MSEWATYTLSDLLMFSTRTYFRLFERYNVAVWPLHLLAVVIGLALVLLARRGDARSGRIAAVLAGLCWLWVAWAFHAERYATINSAAVYFAAGFALQGVLLVSAGRLQAAWTWPGAALLLVALFGYPLLALASGQPWQQADLFGMTPDATAAVTLALLALSRRAHWSLWLLPLVWSAISGATLWTMDAAQAQTWALPLIALLALVQLILQKRQPFALAP